MATVILIVCILAYALWVIRKRVREIKAGKFCSCGDCSSCQCCKK